MPLIAWAGVATLLLASQAVPVLAQPTQEVLEAAPLRLPPTGRAPATAEAAPAPRPRLLPPPNPERVPAPFTPTEIEPTPPEPPLAEEPAGATAALETVTFCEFCGDGCGSEACCDECASSSRWGRFGRAIYRGLCCPDPCYDPQWRPLADTAFFTAAVRPQNQQRFRWDYAEDMTQPDRAEYFWARAGASGKGPDNFPTRGIDYDELRHYTEVAHGAFGASIEYSYRSLDAQGPTDATSESYAGFGDLTIGTKTLLFDTNLVQLAFQFQTHVPQGSPAKGLGTGHTSLEPGLILGLNLSPNSYLQAEVSEWVPLGGDELYAGPLVRYNVAYNRVLWRPHPGVPLIGTLEVSGWRFQDGAYTPATGTGVLPASDVNFVQTSAGMRLFVCDRADFGVSYATAASGTSWTETLIRTELRFRY